jgi:hypothetical protein
VNIAMAIPDRIRMSRAALLLSFGPIPVLGRPGTAAADELELPPEDEALPLPLLPPPEDAQVGPVIVLAFSVTVPAACAKTRPFKVAPVFRAVTPLSAKMFPMNEVVVPRVAELPIRHHTLQGSPPVTDEPDDVMSVDTVLKIQTPDPVSVRLPDKEKLLVEQ